MKLIGVMTLTPKDNGHTIVFAFNGDGNAYEFECGHDALAQVLLSIQLAAKMASDMRNGHPASPPAEHKPLNMRSVQVGRSRAGETVMKMTTTQGLPVTVSMDQDQVAALIDKLLFRIPT